MNNFFDPPLIGRVIEEWKVTYPDPIDVKEGEIVELGETDPEWPGWQWCTNRRGKSGWVPIAFLALIGQGKGKMRCNYAARELAVIIDEEVQLHQQESGWYWATTKSGNKGWVPARNIQLKNKQEK